MPPASILARLGRKAQVLRHKARLRASLRHVSGPAAFDLSADDVVVMALVRDGGYYLDGFLAHHRGLGARHFVFLDNGSTDDTLSRLAAQPDCAVLASPLPWAEFESDFRATAARRYADGHWCLFVDMDEMFDVPGVARLGLSGLARHLAARGFTALVAQMLEMFPEAPLSQVARLDYAQAIERFDRCDLGDIARHAYRDPDLDFAWWLAQNRVSAPPPPVLFGGMRRRVFGENCCLTKHPLVFLGPGVRPAVHPHLSAGVVCADFTALIRHYKFANDILARDAASVATAAIAHGEDRLRLARLRQSPDLRLGGPDTQPYTGLMPLYEQGFLTGAANLPRGTP